MKGAIVESPGKIVVKEIPDPVIDEYEVLCETLAASVCSGTDNHILNNHPYYNIKFPAVLGHEGIGRVIKCGKRVRFLKKGDIVTRLKNKLPDGSGYTLLYGAFAEKGIATDWQAMKENGISNKIWRPHTVNRVLPTDCDPVALTMLITWRETYSFLNLMGRMENKSVLILGSGATALSFANHAVNMDMSVAAIGSPGRSNAFSKVGVNNIVSYQEQDYKLHFKEAHNEFDFIIDAVGDANTLAKTLGLLKNKGMIGVYGLNSFPNYHFSFMEAPDVFTFYNGEHYDEGSAHDEVMAYYNEGKLDPWNYISKEHVYPLESIKDALDACSMRKTMKSVVIFK
jgi:L-iditol 2-dehydrogenase